MNILLVHLGTPCECFIASSVIKGLRKKYIENHPLNIFMLVHDNESHKIYKYNNHIKLCYLIDKVPTEFKKRQFDLLINLHPDFTESDHFPVSADEKLGFGYTENGDNTYKYMYGEDRTPKNIFQMYYILAGLKWKGEGYSLSYNPKKKNRRNRTGLYIVNKNLFEYVKNKLQLDLSVAKNIQPHKNIFQKLDEINMCENVVTDDFFTLHQSLYLKKNVCFLETIDYNYPIELFKSGKIFKIPRNIIQ